MFETTIESLKIAREAYIESGRKAFRPALDAFLAAHPEVAKLRWTQYAPRFNDGDACVFGVNDPEVLLVDAPAADPDDDEEDGEWRGEWDLGYDGATKSLPFVTKLQADLKSLGEFFGECEDVMEELFGDGYRVTVGREGEPDVEEYDHD